MAALTVSVKKDVPVKFLQAQMNVRYWEDGSVNGVQDSDDDPKMPLKAGDCWNITVELETGKILDWPHGVTAKTHYKVCDGGTYSLLDETMQPVASLEWYVPTMLAPCGEGYGDYVILNIDGDGQIEGWKADLSFFESEEY